MKQSGSSDGLGLCLFPRQVQRRIHLSEHHGDAHRDDGGDDDDVDERATL